MIKIDEIRHLHLELSSLCNARCPFCIRNVLGYPYNRGYTETNLSLAQIKQWFSPVFISQLYEVLLNGNFGDLMMNTETEQIISYFRECSDRIKIAGNTNGSARTPDFWRNLGSMGTIMYFALDGLEDTHHLHRQDTVWQRIIDNAMIFKAAGGYAMWKMILFDHNRHQVEDCREMSKKLGFDEFWLIDEGRNTGPVFDRSGKLSHHIGNSSGPTNLAQIMNFRNKHNILLPTPSNSLSCHTKNEKSIFVSSTGKVYPCCFLAAEVLNWSEGQLNAVTRQIMENNDLNIVDLATAIQWFPKVESRWSEMDPNLRVSQCDSSCGR